MLQLIHEAIDDTVGLIFCDVGEMGVDGGCFGRHVSEVGLNQTQVDSEFHQMGGVGMPEGSDGSALVDAALSQSCSEGILDIGYGRWPDCPCELIMFAGSSGRWEDPMRIAVCLYQLRSSSKVRFGRGT